MKIGILGAGSLAGFLVQGAGAGVDVLVSPRGQSADLAARFGVAVADSNQDLVDRADHIIACLPAGSGREVLSSLRFRPGQSVLSAMAGLGILALAQAVAPARAAVAMMPGHANALGVGPSILHPADNTWAAFLGRLGPVHQIDTAEAFDLAAVFGALSGATIHWMAHLAGWFQARGLDPALARALVAQTLRGNAEVLMRSDQPLDQIAKGVTTPGGITEQVVSALQQAGALDAWDQGLERVRRRLQS